MRKYELVLILKESLNEAARKKLLETVKSSLKPARNASQGDAGGDVKIIKEDSWGEKALSYPIKREKSGFYFFFSLESSNAVPNDFEKKILAQENILRHLLIRK